MGQRSGGPRQRRTSSATRNTPPTKPSTTCTTGRSGRSALLRGRQLQGVRRGAAPAAARRLRRGPASGRCRAGLAAELRRHGHGHQAGTARFETDPSASVLDVQCKADDLDNLYVADGSFMPSIGAVNPTLTIIANALRVGDHVAERIGPTRHPQRPHPVPAHPTRISRDAENRRLRLAGRSAHGRSGERRGSVDWLCLPRFDSPAAFAALLHNEEAGHWALGPAGASNCTARRYAGNTLVLETD